MDCASRAETEPGSRLPAAASCLGRHAHPAGRSPNSSSLFLPLAAVVAVAQGLFSRRTIRRVLRVALAAFSAAPWQGFEKAERCPSLASLFPPQAAVGSAAVRIHPCSPFCKTDKTETPVPIGYRSSWWSEATQIRTIALWGIFGGDFIESDGFCAVFVVECNQNFFIIEINSIHEGVDERFPVAFHVRVEFAEPGQPEPNLIFA